MLDYRRCRKTVPQSPPFSPHPAIRVSAPLEALETEGDITMKACPDEVARLLRRWREGDLNALAELMPRVYDDLCRLARVLLRREEEDPFLQPAALVHDIYLRLRAIHAPGWDTRAHFYGFV